MLEHNSKCTSNACVKGKERKIDRCEFLWTVLCAVPLGFFKVCFLFSSVCLLRSFVRSREKREGKKGTGIWRSDHRRVNRGTSSMSCSRRSTYSIRGTRRGTKRGTNTRRPLKHEQDHRSRLEKQGTVCEGGEFAKKSRKRTERTNERTREGGWERRERIKGTELLCPFLSNSSLSLSLCLVLWPCVSLSKARRWGWRWDRKTGRMFHSMWCKTWVRMQSVGTPLGLSRDL